MITLRLSEAQKEAVKLAAEATELHLRHSPGYHKQINALRSVMKKIERLEKGDGNA